MTRLEARADAWRDAAQHVQSLGDISMFHESVADFAKSAAESLRRIADAIEGKPAEVEGEVAA